jgi:hypothetical protein
VATTKTHDAAVAAPQKSVRTQLMRLNLSRSNNSSTVGRESNPLRWSSFSPRSKNAWRLPTPVSGSISEACLYPRTIRSLALSKPFSGPRLHQDQAALLRSWRRGAVPRPPSCDHLGEIRATGSCALLQLGKSTCGGPSGRAANQGARCRALCAMVRQFRDAALSLIGIDVLHGPGRSNVGDRERLGHRCAVHQPHGKVAGGAQQQ